MCFFSFIKIHSHWLSRPQTLVKAMLMHSVNIPGEEEKHHWARRCGSHVRRDLHDSSLLPFHAWVTSSVSCYPKPMWWAHVPEGQSFTFSASYIVWPEMNRQGILAGDGVILPKGERELLVGYFRISWGFVISSRELGDLRGESWAAVGAGIYCTWQSNIQVKCAFDLCWEDKVVLVYG